MKIGVLGTGVVGQTISGKLAELGHEVMVGTREVAKTMARPDTSPYGLPAFSVWKNQFQNVRLGTFAEAAVQSELIFNAVSGLGSLDALRLAGESNLKGKVMIDISNPLDFSQGMPPALSVSNTDSLGEQIQRSFPEAKVVKTLNTVTATLMVNPRQLADGKHDVFVCGNDIEAKAMVTGILRDWFGWKNVIDLGDITASRGTEMYLPIWLRIWGAFGTGMFNVKIVR